MTLRFIKEIPSDMFLVLDEIAVGSFSNIFSATHVNTNTKVALKVYLAQNKEEVNLMDQEIMINKTLNHPFICKFFSEIDTEHLKIVSMELIDGVSLREYVSKKGKLTIIEAQDIFAQLLITFEYLHDEAHITHHNLNIENIMVDIHNHIRLIDFGFNSQNSTITQNIKSIPFCAPEVLLGQNYTKQSDIWSMGIILFYLVHGDLPFYSDDKNTLIQLILNSNIIYPTNFDYDLCDLLSKMLNKDPTKRISLNDIKLHTFIKNDKILNIDYKRLFSPTQNTHEIPSLKCYKHDPNIKISMNSVSPIYRRNHSKSLYTPTSYTQKNNLHDVVNLKTDDINLTIESRKNYSNSLNALIQSAFDPNSKYYLSKFKTRKGRVSMTRSCSHMVGNNQLYQQNLKQMRSNQSDAEIPIDQLAASNDEDSPLEQLLNSNDSFSPELRSKVNNSPMTNLLNSNYSLTPNLRNKVNDSPLEQLLNSNDSLAPNSKNEVEDSPMKRLFNSIDSSNSSKLKNDYEDSPMKQLLNSSSPNLAPNIGDSPMKRFLNSTDSLPSISNHSKSGSNNKDDEESPMKRLLRSTDSLPPRSFQNQLRLNIEDKDSLMNRLLLSSNSFTTRPGQDQASDGSSQSDFHSSSARLCPLSALSSSGSKNMCSFKRIQAPMMALNRKPSIQKFKLDDNKPGT